ncbi:MAG TPA: C4-type zinc ribbon domain-containing protein [Anaerolineales bacterium]|nr:C4-type zinc ribbon domain-containing protein [Anaerolineales bacterium]
MSAALGLYRLQQVDSQIDQIQARLKTIRQTLENDATLRAATEHFAAAESRHKDAERALKLSEADVEKQRIKIEQTEASLYGGRVQNPKELQDLQKDAASLKRHLETLEERELEAMLIMESAEKDLQATEAELEKVQSNLREQNSDLAKESDMLRRELERLNAERMAVVTDIANPSLSIYEQLRSQKRGLAITTIADNSCEACGTTLTASQQQSARSTSQLFHCPTCGRILYAN